MAGAAAVILSLPSLICPSCTGPVTVTSHPISHSFANTKPETGHTIRLGKAELQVSAANDGETLFLEIRADQRGFPGRKFPPDGFALWFKPDRKKGPAIGIERAVDPGRLIRFCQEHFNFWKSVDTVDQQSFINRLRENAPLWILETNGLLRPLLPDSSKNGFRATIDRADSLVHLRFRVPLKTPFYDIRPLSGNKLTVGLGTGQPRTLGLAGGRSGSRGGWRRGFSGGKSRFPGRKGRSPGSMTWFALKLSGDSYRVKTDESIPPLYGELLKQHSGVLRPEKGGRLTGTPPSVFGEATAADSTLLVAGIKWFSELLQLEDNSRERLAKSYFNKLPRGTNLVIELRLSTELNPVYLSPVKWEFFLEQDKFTRWEPAAIDTSSIHTISPPAPRKPETPTVEADPLVAALGKFKPRLNIYSRKIHLAFTNVNPSTERITFVALPVNNPGAALTLNWRWPSLTAD